MHRLKIRCNITIHAVGQSFDEYTNEYQNGQTADRIYNAVPIFRGRDLSKLLAMCNT